MGSSRTHIESVIATFSLRDTSGPSPNVAETDVTAQSELVFFQRSSFGNTVRRYLHDLSYKISPTVQPLFVSTKLMQDFRSRKAKQSDVNQQCVVYHFLMWSVRCRLCRLHNLTSFSRRHVREHKHSVIGKRLRDVHNLRNRDLRDQFTILKKYHRKLDYLSYEMFFYQKQKNNT